MMQSLTREKKSQRHLFSHRREAILPGATTCAHLEGIMQSEISQTEKDKFCVVLSPDGPSGLSQNT